METVNVEIHKEIIEACQHGNRKAQQDLYNLYAKAMYNICLRMLQDAEHAQDLLQESFIQAFTKISTFSFQSTFGAWLKRIVINKCINELKRRKLELAYLEQNPITHEEVTEIEKEESNIEYEVQKVKQCIRELPEGYRVILTLYLLEGYDHREIAEILDISENTSKSQYHRAKKKLIDLMNCYE